MKTLNLVYPEKSDIKFKVSKFPDGQQQVTINLPLNLFETIIPPYKAGVYIKSRLNNFQDLELIICATKSLRELGVKEIHLYAPYFLGSRSDRKFEEGSNNYLKDVICPIINSLNFESVTVLDSHSHVLEACLNNFKKESNISLVRNFAIPEIIKTMNLPARLNDEYHTTPGGFHYDKRGFDNLIFISPDAGASRKINKLAEQIGYKGDTITCSKERDKDGKLTKCMVPLDISHRKKDFIIVDDICDGGQTFINIVKEIKSKINPSFEGKIYLIITHGIFSKNFHDLNQYFDGIYCTNSYKDFQDDDNFKQLNIF